MESRDPAISSRREMDDVGREMPISGPPAWVARCAAGMLLALLLALGFAGRADAQVVRGRLTSAQGGGVLAGALVTLLDGRGAPVRVGVADAAGQYQLTAPAAGSYRVKVDRVGFGSHTTGEFALAAGQTLEMPVAVPPVRVSLAAIRVEAAPRCNSRSRDGDALRAVWEEARKALQLTNSNTSAALLSFDYRHFERHLSPNGRKVEAETSQMVHLPPGTVAFASLPADSLAAGGYVRVLERTGQVSYFAPDADVLLSEVFLDGHCFSLRNGQQGTIGLHFEPLRGNAVADVRGTLWLDRATAELRFMEFTYTGLPHVSPRTMGGRVDFARMPNGAWVIHDWALRWPVAAMRYNGRSNVLTIGRARGVQEAGASLVAVRLVEPGDTAQTSAAPAAASH
jgi:hypothetical protein